MNKTIKSNKKKKTLKADKKDKIVSIFTNKKKNKSSNIKIAFYIVFIIIMILVLYLVNFKKPNSNLSANENNVISEMLNNGDLGSEHSDKTGIIPLPTSFKVYKQSNLDASGPCSILTILSYYAKDGIFSEEIIENMKSAHEPFHKGTCINQMKEILSTLKLKYWTDDNYRNIKELNNIDIGVNLVKNAIKLGYPMIVGWNNNGQWSVILGYDDKATTDTVDDEIIMANAENGANLGDFSNIKASDFATKWSFNGFFKGEPTAQAKDKNCFIILDKNN